jgi:hypothetical protein
MDELLKKFYKARVRYVLVGGQAMRLIGMPRFSMDWDFFIPARDAENLSRLNALSELVGPAGFEPATKRL